MCCVVVAIDQEQRYLAKTCTSALEQHSKAVVCKKKKQQHTRDMVYRSNALDLRLLHVSTDSKVTTKENDVVCVEAICDPRAIY